MSYTHTNTVDLSYTDAVEQTKQALSEQGFGILSEIDVRSTFEKKLGAEAGDELGDYVILGACNPGLAQRGLTAEPDLGALLPCNVVVRHDPSSGTTVVQAIDPQTMVELSGTDAVREVANDADTRLRAALAQLPTAAEA
ncbi:DUF302 domain-containing protein [Arthrobacter castelli]|uniref:DUF302 domain-containing protein n=1 Tax=Arthrobacter castelli TaxID=271431 RepID=UPI000402EBCF|nr:DUF302 domain-containing protein [Arthrobacter castelli]